jgi:hypothetical protein
MPMHILDELPHYGVLCREKREFENEILENDRSSEYKLSEEVWRVLQTIAREKRLTSSYMGQIMLSFSGRQPPNMCLVWL